MPPLGILVCGCSCTPSRPACTAVGMVVAELEFVVAADMGKTVSSEAVLRVTLRQWSFLRSLA